MFRDDLIDIVNLEFAVPDGIGINDHDRALVVLLIAAHARGAHVLKVAFFDQVAQALQQLLRTLPAAVVTPHRSADEDMQGAFGWLRHPPIVATWQAWGQMDLNFAFFADRASVPPDGKLYVLGGGFTGIGLAEIPGRADLSVVAQFRFIAADVARKHVVELRLLDGDGRLLLPPASLQFQAEGVSPHPGDEITIPTVTVMQPTFGLAGLYAVEFWYEGRQLRSLPLRVFKVEMPQPAPPAAGAQ